MDSKLCSEGSGCHVDPQINERVTRLETCVLALRDDLVKIDTTMTSGFKDLGLAMSATSRTNWSTIVAVLLGLLALYGATVRPITADVARQEAGAAIQAVAVLEQNKQIIETRVQLASYVRDMERLQRDLADIVRNGSPASDKQLAILEVKMAFVQKMLGVRK